MKRAWAESRTALPPSGNDIGADASRTGCAGRAGIRNELGNPMFVDQLPPQPIPLCVVLLAIVTASTDLVARRIPNPIVLCGLVGALIVQVWLHGLWAGAAVWGEGALAGFAVLFPFYLLRGMAAGDVKLMMTIGAWVGPGIALHIALVTFLVGGAWSLVVVVRAGKLRQLMQMVARCFSSWIPGIAMAVAPPGRQASLGSLPYGVAIAAGTVGVLFAAVA
jgi:prepilin peptidase CpaA